MRQHWDGCLETGINEPQLLLTTVFAHMLIVFYLKANQSCSGIFRQAHGATVLPQFLMYAPANIPEY